MKDMLDLLVTAALAGGAIVSKGAEDGPAWIREKRANDFVTAADEAAEKAIAQILYGAYPEIPLLAEEGSGHALGAEEKVFCVDPLDGTNNFVHGIPIYCVSVGFVEAGEPVLGAVYDPVHDELFSGGRDVPSTLNGNPISTSGRKDFSGAFVATGFPFKKLDRIEHYVQGMKNVCIDSGGLRRCGSAALDLVWTACGRFDCFWEWGLSPWDVAAAAAIVRGAGGTVTDFEGGHGYLFGGTIVAGATPEITEALLRDAWNFI